MKKASGFEKFYKGKAKKGAAKKEEIRKEKRVARKEREEKIKQAKASRAQFTNQKQRPDKEKTIQAPKYNLEPLQKKKNNEKVNKPSSAETTPNAKPQTPDNNLMPLNKYIAHSGVCSRRDAVDLIKSGKVKVNGELITEPGHKVSIADNIALAGKKIIPEKDFVYILLNKPKDYLTTTDDPQQRKTVLDLLRNAPPVRFYPVGRLDRNTTGVLLLTNDGDLSQKLTHPSSEVKKVYAVTLDKPLNKNHFEEILKGVPLEDGMVHVDALAYGDIKDHTQIGIELHTGRNRIVRRIFEHFGYDVKMLDRVIFAGLTKKNVNRGKWRFLTEKEVRNLKFFGKGKK